MVGVRGCGLCLSKVMINKSYKRLGFYQLGVKAYKF